MGAPESGAGHRDGADKVAIAGREGLRYRAQMKRSLPKLAVRRETIRALATLELTRAVGGDAAVVAETDTCKAICTLAAVVKPPVGG